MSPANWPNATRQDWESFWASAKALSGYLGIHVEWNDSGDGEIPRAILDALGQGVRPVVLLGIDDVVGSEENIVALKGMVHELLTSYKIDYLGFGNEINERDGFDDLAGLINEMAEYARSLATSTLTFTVFQYESLGGRKDAAARLAAVPAVDLVAFTSYPFLKYSSAEDIPEGYYAPIRQWTTKPIAFTEIAWPSRQNHPGYPSIKGSEAEQTSFIGKLKGTLVSGLDVLFVNWLSLHDLADWSETDPIVDFKQIFDSCGLLPNRANQAKRSYAAWM